MRHHLAPPTRSESLTRALALAALVLLTACPSSAPPSEPVPSEAQGQAVAEESPAAAPTLSATEAPTSPPTRRPKARAAARPAPTDGLHLLRRDGREDGPIPYLVVEPAKGAVDLPLVVALHGRGSSARRFADLIEDLRLPVRAIVASAPLPWGRRDGKQWFEFRAPDGPQQVLKRVEDLGVLTDHLAKTFPGSPRPILLGFSQGAMLTLQALARDPGRYAGGIAMSGFLPVEDGNTKKEAPVSEATAPTVLVTGGTGDTVITSARSKAAGEALEALGHRVEWLEFNGGHTVPGLVRARIKTFVADLIAAD